MRPWRWGRVLFVGAARKPLMTTLQLADGSAVVAGIVQAEQNAVAVERLRRQLLVDYAFIGLY